MMVIKFEGGFRLVRTHRSIELWHNGARLDQFATWEEAIAHLDKQAGYEVPAAEDVHDLDCIGDS